MFVIDGNELTEGQRLYWCADDEHGQVPKIRATFNPQYPFCVTTPSGEPIRAYAQFKHAALAKVRLLQELDS